MPLAVEQLDVSAYDIVISNSHAVAKGVITRSDQLHLCYCHSPVRYAWDLYHQYLGEAGLRRGLRGAVAKLMLHYLRLWDLGTVNRIDHFMANSHYIARRIHKVYRRSATVVYPPVDTDGFTLQTKKEDFYLTASRMVPYKRIDLIVRAFAQMPDKQLIVIGDGPEVDKVRAAAGPNVTLLGFQTFAVLKDHLQRARAFVFAAEEDFGIIPVEAQACGTPVIAYGRGGSQETIIDKKTGLFFGEQTESSIIAAVKCFEQLESSFSPDIIRRQAEKFSIQAFRTAFLQVVEDACSQQKRANELIN
jgi:glycosyltransferase involved in cell wall biosynthesis